VTHGTPAGAISKLDSDVNLTIATMVRLPREIRCKVEAALFWVREPGRSFLEFPRSSTLRTYSPYWNAFECLVEAVCVVRPAGRLSKTEKQARIDQHLQLSGGEMSVEQLQKLYREVINPGFVGRASHALIACFGEQQGGSYVEECFRLPKSEDRLYDIRNAINHGEIDAENPTELLRVESRLRRLWFIVWGMFGRIVSFPTPQDTSTSSQKF
jgi:hypothetical protein